MNGSRRNFLQTGGKVGLAAMTLGGLGTIAEGQKNPTLPGGKVANPTGPDSLYNITRAMFTQNLKTKFAVSLNGVAITSLTLIEVRDLNQSSEKNNGTTSRDSYALTFTGPERRSLGANTYTIEHAKLGKFQLFVVQGGRNGSEIRYGADINRILS